MYSINVSPNERLSSRGWQRYTFYETTSLFGWRIRNFVAGQIAFSLRDSSCNLLFGADEFTWLEAKIGINIPLEETGLKAGS